MASHKELFILEVTHLLCFPLSLILNVHLQHESPSFRTTTTPQLHRPLGLGMREDGNDIDENLDIKQIKNKHSNWGA